MLLRRVEYCSPGCPGIALIAVLVALLGVFALGQMSSIRDSEVAVETVGCRASVAATRSAN